MEEDNKAAQDEARRVAQHASMKSQVERDVNADIAVEAGHAAPAEAGRIEAVAGAMRGKAIAEVVDTEHEVGRARGLARAGQVVDYIFFVAYTLLGIRLVLALIAANAGSGFVQFIRAVTDPLYAPFRGIINSPVTEDGSTLALPIIVAIVAYIILHVGIKALMRLVAQRSTTV